MDALVLVLAVVVIAIVVAGPPENSNQAGPRLDVRGEAGRDRSGGRWDIPALPLQVLYEDRAYVDGEGHALALCQSSELSMLLTGEARSRIGGVARHGRAIVPHHRVEFLGGTV